jgi:hypothetical protein
MVGKSGNGNEGIEINIKPTIIYVHSEDTFPKVEALRSIPFCFLSLRPLEIMKKQMLLINISSGNNGSKIVLY